MNATLLPQQLVVDWGNFLDVFIENISFPASVKIAHTGQYIKANEQAAQAAGLTREHFIGLNLQDIAERVQLPTHVVNQITHMDNAVIQYGEMRTFRQTFVDYAQDIRLEQVFKVPTVTHPSDSAITGILSYTQDIKSRIELNQLFTLYQQHFASDVAITRLLHYLKVAQFFYETPSEQELLILLSMRKHSHSKYIAEDLNLHYRIIDKQKATLRDKLHTLNLEAIVSVIRSRHEHRHVSL